MSVVIGVRDRERWGEIWWEGGGGNVPIMSANLERGTATSVDQISVPGGLVVTMVKRASLRADQRSCSSCLVLAKWKAPAL